jgi:hypothetical protein
MAKIVMTGRTPGAPPSPYPGTKPVKNPERLAARWEQALKVVCPECEQPPQQRCFNKAPSHATANVRYETRQPHRARLRAARS